MLTDISFDSVGIDFPGHLNGSSRWSAEGDVMEAPS
jgi:hypothetical protein